MPVVPQITNPFQGKGYQSSLSNNQKAPGGEQFEIIQLTKPKPVAGQAERDADHRAGRQLPNRTDLPQMMVKTAKDPSMAVVTLKQLISSDLLATAAANGYTELHGELEGLNKSIYLALGDLVREMMNQEEQTTMFSKNPLFDLLRNLAGMAQSTGNQDASQAIANFLKAVNFSFNRDEILNALSANLKFLSKYFQPSPPLSEKLGGLSDAWASPQARENFELLKGETIKLLQNVSESLLNNEKTQVLIPLIIHNLSRYNTNDYMLKDAFSALMTHVPHSQKGAFMAAFDGFLEAALYGKLNKPPENVHTQPKHEQPVDNNAEAAKNQPGKQTESSVKTEFPQLYAQKLASGGVFPPPGMTQDSLADGLRGFLLGKLSGMEAVEKILMNLIDISAPGAEGHLQNALNSDLVKTDSITALINYLNNVLQQLPDVPERQVLFEMLSETVSGMAEKGELPPETTQKEPPVHSEPKHEQTQQTQSNHQPGTADKQELTDKPLPKSAEQTQQNQAAAPKSSLEELTSFIQKNINHTALKTMDSYNASNLLQSLINAPGVYTPLSHFIIPLQIGDVKAFGELWVDNEERGGNGGKKGEKDKNYHLFLTFEIESVGRFETDLYAHGTQVSLAVLHPESFSDEMTELKKKINKIVAATDYTMKEFQTAVLREPHDLTQIFPRIVEKRTGLDIVI